MRKSIYSILLFFVAAVSIVSCSDDPVLKRFNGNEIVDESTSDDKKLTYQDTVNILVDYFAIDVLETYYVWSDEPGMKEQIENYLNPDTCDHPQQTILLARHKDDRWTQLIPNLSEELESLQGVETTLGMHTTPYLLGNSEKVFIVVNAVYDNSPASDANIKRGDIFTKMNGKTLTKFNYQKFYDISTSVQLEFGVITEDNYLESSGNTVELTPIKMYEDPVVATNVFDIDGKKVGYLAYMSFTQDTTSLFSACNEFKQAGISELILDLRYNGGGLVSTLNAFASILAPENVVANEEIFERSIYNKILSEIFKDDVEKFQPKYLPNNLNLKKIYALVTKYTASASESLLVGLKPFMDIEIIGQQTHGKYCTGNFLKPENVYKKEYYNKYKKYYGDWGIYVMINTFGDKDGRNDSRPNGFIPDYEVKDDQFDGYQLGDINETMLSKALELAGMKYPNEAKTRSFVELPYKEIYVERPTYNIKMNLKPINKLQNSKNRL